MLLTGLLPPRCAIFRLTRCAALVISFAYWRRSFGWAPFLNELQQLTVAQYCALIVRKWTHKCFYEVCELFCFFSLLSGDGRGTSSKSATTTTVTPRNCVHIWSLCGWWSVGRVVFCLVAYGRKYFLVAKWPSEAA